MPSRRKVALLFGGRSGEHEVSLRSAASVAAGLEARHDVLPLFIDKAGRWLLQSGQRPSPGGGEPVFVVPSPEDRGRLRRLKDAAIVAEPDVFFPVLHGTYGEDGTIQGLLDLCAVAYVGAGCAASAAAMDKETMKALFAHAGVPQGPYRVLRGRDPGAEEAAVRALGLPLFVKPANLGSSVAVSKVKRGEDLEAALAAAFAYDRKAVLEAAIDAREIEVSVLGNDRPEASLPGEIVPDREFYDYDSMDPRAPRGRPGGRAARPRGPRLQGRGRVGLRPRRLLSREEDRPHPRERDQHDPRLHVDQHVPQAVGGHGPAVPRPPRDARGPGPRAPGRARPPPHRLSAMKALLLAAAPGTASPAIARLHGLAGEPGRRSEHTRKYAMSRPARRRSGPSPARGLESRFTAGPSSDRTGPSFVYSR